MKCKINCIYDPHTLNLSPLFTLIALEYKWGGKSFFTIYVEKHPTPVLLDSRYYIRKGNITSSAEEDLIDALSASVPSIKPNILSSLQEEEPTKKTSKHIDNSLENDSF